MKKIVSLMFVILIMFSLCACSGSDDEQYTTTSPNIFYEQCIYGEWKRENSDVVMMLTSGNYGTKKQRGLTTSLYWEADAEKILIKENQLSNEEGLPYTLEADKLTIHNANGTKTVYRRVK